MDNGHPRGPSGESDPVTRCFLARRDRLAGTAFHILGHREDAMEAVQEAFVKCWRKRHDTNGVRNLDAWVFSVVMNTARDLRRRRRVRLAEALPTEETMPLPGTEADPAKTAERNEAVARVRAAIAKLPDHEREVFLLRQNGDFTLATIAELLGAPLGTVKTRMRAALRRLREAMEPEAHLQAVPARRSSP